MIFIIILGKQLSQFQIFVTIGQENPYYLKTVTTAVLREAWATLPESSSLPLPATLAQTRNLAHASLETAL